MASESIPLSRETIHRILSTSRRRHLLSVLAGERESDLETLADRVAARERDGSVGDVPEAARRRTLVALVHADLPLLADHGLLEYEPGDGEVAIAGPIDERIPFEGSIDRLIDVSASS